MKNSEKGQDAIEGSRIYWLDNLRTFTVFLVILLHAALVYEKNSIGALFWIVIDPSTNNLPGIVFFILDIFTMPILFFISGFFTPLSLKDKKTWPFLKSKFIRLIIPWAFAVLTLIPLYKIIFLYSRNMPQENWTTYFHWSNGIWSQNWLWFLPVLFLFNILYLLFSEYKISVPNISPKAAVLGTFLIGFIYSISMEFLGLQGWIKTVLLK